MKYIYLNSNSSLFLLPLLMFFLIPLHGLRAQENSDKIIPLKIQTVKELDSREEPTEMKYEASFFRERLLHYSFDAFIDNSLRTTVYQIETVGDYSTPDRTAYSLHGGSYLWNKFYFDGIRINDPLQAGNSMYKPLLLHTGLKARLNSFSINFLPEDIHQPYFSLDVNAGGLGGVTEFTQPMVEWFHSTADERLKIPLNERRRIKSAANLYFAVPMNEEGSYFDGNISYGRRTLPDFNFEGLEEFYPEDYVSAFMHYRIRTDHGWFRKKGFLFSYLNRNHLNAELYYGKEESASLNSVNATIYGKNESKTASTHASLSLGYKGIAHHNADFSRNILDQDGEGFEPWYPSSDDLHLSLQLDHKKELIRGLDYFVSTYNSLLQFSPRNSSAENSIYMRNADTALPLYHIQWESRSFTAALLENRTGLSYEKELGENAVLELSSAFSLDGFLLRGKSRLSPGLEASMGIDWQPYRFLSLGIQAGKKNIPYHSEHLRFFSDDYMNGEWNYWADQNGDMTYQQNEGGALYRYSGGLYHEMSLDLEQNSYFYLDIPIEFNWGPNKFFIYNYYKQFLNLWNINYASDPENIGHFNIIGDEEVYYLDEAPTYVAAPLNRAFIADQSGDASALFSNPHYFGNTFGYSRKTKRLYFSISWTSFQIQTFSALGHGLLHNTPGILSETMANPNTRENSLGRADADRGFIARTLLTYKISDAFKASFQFRYIDGQPFTKFLYFPESSGDYNQLAILPYISKGNNPWPNGGGPREDGFFNNALRVEYNRYIGAYQWGAVLSVYNMFDFRTNLSEYVFPDDNERYVLEYTIPRGIMARVWVKM